MQLIILGVEGVALSVFACLYMCVLLTEVTNHRFAMYNIFMLIPVGLARGLATRPLGLGDDDEDADDIAGVPLEGAAAGGAQAQSGDGQETDARSGSEPGVPVYGAGPGMSKPGGANPRKLLAETPVSVSGAGFEGGARLCASECAYRCCCGWHMRMCSWVVLRQAHSWSLLQLQLAPYAWHVACAGCAATTTVRGMWVCAHTGAAVHGCRLPASRAQVHLHVGGTPCAHHVLAARAQRERGSQAPAQPLTLHHGARCHMSHVCASGLRSKGGHVMACDEALRLLGHRSADSATIWPDAGLMVCHVLRCGSCAVGVVWARRHATRGCCLLGGWNVGHPVWHELAAWP